MYGRILFNGNGGSELIERAAPVILGAAGGRPPKVLLVTAAWGPGEFGASGLKDALWEAGLPREQPVENLCAWHTWMGFLERRPDVARLHAEIAAARQEVRDWYIERTRFDADMVKAGANLARRHDPSFRVGALDPRSPVGAAQLQPTADFLVEAIGTEIRASLATLVENDERMLVALTAAEEQLLARAGLRYDGHWQAERNRLEARILSADAILLLGGSPTKLLDALRFFDLQPALLETLRRGATLVATSAGALVLCQRMIVFDDGNPDPRQRHFQLLDRGLGLVGGLQVLPHCMDRIHTDDPDNLAYLARRFGDRHCVGLNRESYLLVEPGAGRATSVGEHDGVYVFGEDGRKLRYHRGEALPV
jgi:cyanophycinase-like exopeptidase